MIKKQFKKYDTLIRYHDTYITLDKSCLRKFLSYFDYDFSFARQALDIQLADDHAKNQEKVKEKIVIILQGKNNASSNGTANMIMLPKKKLDINGNDLIRFRNIVEKQIQNN